MTQKREPTTAVVVGAGGGIGAALVTRLVEHSAFDRVLALSRRPERGDDEARLVTGAIDLGDEASIAAAARQVAAQPPLRLLIVATGILQDDRARPERSWRALDPAALAHVFAVNTIGPALVLKHFLPLLPRAGRAAAAVLSARVGSIGDNRLGGWYGYRASKAALNQIVRCAAIELARSHREALCVALHPGTVDTGLSKPFQAGVPPGQLSSPVTAAEHLLAVLDGLGAADSGGFFAWDGAPIPF